ncbi:MAG: hypothetical protein NDI81_00805 [Desulfobacula sp.]|nr:hypothetical protein [Desulfobacula sp.]
MGCLKKIMVFSIVMTVFIAGRVYGDEYSEMKKLPRLSAQNAFILSQQKKIVLLDVHPGENKQKASVLGAYYLDHLKVDKMKLNFPKEQLIGVYCD